MYSLHTLYLTISSCSYSINPSSISLCISPWPTTAMFQIHSMSFAVDILVPRIKWLIMLFIFIGSGFKWPQSSVELRTDKAAWTEQDKESRTMLTASVSDHANYEDTTNCLIEPTHYCTILTFWNNDCARWKVGDYQTQKDHECLNQMHLPHSLLQIHNGILMVALEEASGDD